MKLMNPLKWTAVMALGFALSAQAQTPAQSQSPASAPARTQPQLSEEQQRQQDEMRAAGNDPDKLDQLFDKRSGAQQAYLGEVAGNAWKRVYLDPASSDARRAEAEEKLRKYAAAMMASDSLFTHQGKSIPMIKWKGQGLIATIENSSPGKVLGNYGLTTMDRKPVSLADHRGKVVMLDFWATWCKPCIASMPSVKAFTEEMQGKPFEVLGVNYGDSAEKAQAFHDAGEVAMPWTHLHQETFTEEYFRWSLGSIPTYIVLDANGVVIARGNRFDDTFKETIRTAVAAVKTGK